jgi:hypothetical protein
VRPDTVADVEAPPDAVAVNPPGLDVTRKLDTPAAAAVDKVAHFTNALFVSATATTALTTGMGTTAAEVAAVPTPFAFDARTEKV